MPPKTQSKSPKSIGNYSPLNNTYRLENNSSSIINSNKNEINNTSDTDNASEEDSKTEDEDLTPLPSHSIPNISNNTTNSNTKSANKHCIYNFELNQKEYKQELVQSLIEKLKIALTLVLHDMSPIWNNNINNEYKENNSIYPKGNLSMKGRFCLVLEILGILLFKYLQINQTKYTTITK